MRRYIVLLLITGIVWAQTDFDKLVLKDGTTYLGEYSKTEEEIVYFKPQNAFTFQPISIKQIQTLELKDGHFIIVRGYAKKIPLAIEEYQKLSTKEKAIYDANLYNVKKWALYMPTSIITFWGFYALHYSLRGDEDDYGVFWESEFWESPIFWGGSSAASLIIPYFVLNRKEKFNFPKSILTGSEKEIYEQAYFKKLQERKFKYAVVTCIVAGVIVAVAGSSFNPDLSSSSGGDYNGHTPW
jgi:hypothetical protein